tara:strand:+ start:1328 stop:1522 length:195 start_codon:yes stop_codon:yes gene_type:complete
MFTHPKEVCMTYWEHFCLSMNFAKIFGIASVKAIIHAIYPDIYITSTTDATSEIQKILKTKGCR